MLATIELLPPIVCHWLQMNNPISNILTEESVIHISEWGIIALLARYARVYETLLIRNCTIDVKVGLKFMEHIAEKGLGDPLMQVAEIFEPVENLIQFPATQEIAVKAASEIAKCLRATWAESMQDVITSAQEALYNLILLDRRTFSRSLKNIEIDIDSLIEFSQTTDKNLSRTAFQLWRHGPPDKIPQGIFSQYCRFETGEFNSIVPFIDRDLVSYFRQYPEKLHELSGREFEEFIAEIFYRFGFNVELTATTHDLGRDIIAINQEKQMKYLIECKRWKKNVGIAVVQRLHGVVQSESATKGIIATTANFTTPAKKFMDSERVKWQLEGCDYDKLVKWMKRFDQGRIQK